MSRHDPTFNPCPKPVKAEKGPRKRMRQRSKKRRDNPKPVKRKKASPYNVWLHRYCTCVATGQPEFQNAHSGGLSEGKGMAVKAWESTILPLIAPLHWYEEQNRKTFWANLGLPDHLEIAADLHKCFEEGGDPTHILEAAQARVDRDYVLLILGEIDF